MKLEEAAERFVRERYGDAATKDGILRADHLKGVLTRLKSIGMSDDEILAAAWLEDIMSMTRTSFDEIDRRFGSKVAVLVLALFKDLTLPRDHIEKQYDKQLKESPIEVKMIKLCDISTTLKEIKNSARSKSRKIKEIKREVRNLNLIKQDISTVKHLYPGIQNITNGINETITSLGQRPIAI